MSTGAERKRKMRRPTNVNKKKMKKTTNNIEMKWIKKQQKVEQYIPYPLCFSDAYGMKKINSTHAPFLLVMQSHSPVRCININECEPVSVRTI